MATMADNKKEALTNKYCGIGLRIFLCMYYFVMVSSRLFPVVMYNLSIFDLGPIFVFYSIFKIFKGKKRKTKYLAADF